MIVQKAELPSGEPIPFGMTGEITRINDDGTVTLRLHGFDYPITTRGEHLSLVAKKKTEPGERKKLFDKPD